jgi:hypothetical protein
MRKGLCTKLGVSATLALAAAALAQPANDLCANAQLVAVGSTAWDNTNAGTEGPDATCGFGGALGSSDIFFTFVAPNTATYSFDTCTGGTLGDTIVQVFTGSCGGLTQVACNDDFCGLLSRATVSATAGTTYSIRLSSFSPAVQGTGTLSIAEAPPAPGGDLCDSPLVATIGSTSFDTTTATNDDTTNCGGSGPDVFYSFTPAVSGGYQIDTCGSSFDTVLALLSDCFTEVVCNDQADCGGGIGDQSVLSVSLVAGTTYIIQVDGFGGSSGAGTLNINGPLAGPANDLCANAAVATVGSNAFNSSFAGTEGTASCGFGGDPGGSDVFFTFTAPSADTWRFATCGSSFDTIVSVFDACGGTELACNDDACGLQSAAVVALTAGQVVRVRIAGFAGASGAGTLDIAVPPAGDSCAAPLVATVGSTSFDTSAAGGDDATNCGGSGPDLFYSFTPAASGGYQIDTCGSGFDTVIAVLSDCSTEIICNDDSDCGAGFSLQSTVAATLVAGTTYIIQVDGFGGASGAGTLNISGPISGPANDLCANATPVTLGSNPFDNRFAGTEGTSSCGFGGSTGFSDVYFSFVAPAANTYRFDTCGTFDTQLSIEDGCGGTELACNDDSCGLSSALSIALTAGQNVRVRVAGWDAASQGAGNLNVSIALPNDTCSGTLPALTVGSNPFDTTTAGNDDATNCGGGGPDLFYTFTPTVTAPYQFDTCGSGFDTIVAVLSDCETEIACNDDACGLQSTVVSNLTAGVTYIVQIDGFGAASGSGALNIVQLQAGNDYTACTSSSVFEDISANGTLAAIISACDDCSEDLAIPFTFDFYGAPFTSVNASSNGTMTFGGIFAGFVNAAIPSAAAPNNFAAAIWDDFNPGAAGDVYFATLGTAPNRRFIVSWQNVPQFANTDSNSFQVALMEGTNKLEFRYGTITPAVPGDYTVGVESATGVNGTAIDAAGLGSGNTAREVSPPGTPCGGGGNQCDDIDWNNDGLFPDTQDIDDFLAVFGSGICAPPNPPACNTDIDFNNDGLFPDTLDIDALISVFSGGPCL